MCSNQFWKYLREKPWLKLDTVSYSKNTFFPKNYSSNPENKHEYIFLKMIKIKIYGNPPENLTEWRI